MTRSIWKIVGPIRHRKPPHAHSPGVASGTVTCRLRIDVHGKPCTAPAVSPAAIYSTIGPGLVVLIWRSPVVIIHKNTEVVADFFFPAGHQLANLFLQLLIQPFILLLHVLYLLLQATFTMLSTRNKHHVAQSLDSKRWTRIIFVSC